MRWKKSLPQTQILKNAYYVERLKAIVCQQLVSLYNYALLAPLRRKGIALESARRLIGAVTKRLANSRIEFTPMSRYFNHPPTVSYPKNHRNYYFYPKVTKSADGSQWTFSKKNEDGKQQLQSSVKINLIKITIFCNLFFARKCLL